MSTEISPDPVLRVEATRSGDARKLGDALGLARDALARALLENIADWPKFAAEIEADRDAFIARELHGFVDYLALHFRTGDRAYFDLYVGEKLKQIYHPEEGIEARRERAERLLELDEVAIRSAMADEVGPAEIDLLRATLDEIRRVVLSKAPKSLAVLFIGDCLFLDVQAFLASGCLEDGVAVDPTFLTSKNGPVLRKELRGLAGRKFDLVIYSPFSYEFSPPLASTHSASRALDGRRKIAKVVDEAMADVEATLALIASQCDGTVLVQNTSNVRRHDDSPRERIKNALTRRARRIARELANARLAGAVAKQNAETFEHLFLIDEPALLGHLGESELGRMFYNSDLQHPAVLGRHLAAIYRDLIAAQATLAGKKLVVCDLDNTLWAGEIGEGAVTHFRDRQQTLKRLREKGIVLAVNSKNDEKNVHWDGAELGLDDFVHMQINWDSKIANMKRIRDALNLKYKDYVFVDDRGDQLELVSTALPEILALDASSGRTWRLMAAWESILPRQTEADRTRQYREREARDGFVAEHAEEDQAALFANLGIKVTLREAAKGDLPRVTELINRTNQFNLMGSRTTFGEVNGWQADPATTIVVVEAADKFGPMGLISVAVFRKDGDSLRIPAFVLSCRVFGYGIEAAVLNLAKRLALAEGGDVPLTILGHYKETSHNEPCKAAYPDHGFSWDGAHWAFQGGDAAPDAPWLTIDDRISPRADAPGRRTPTPA